MNNDDFKTDNIDQGLNCKPPDEIGQYEAERENIEPSKNDGSDIESEYKNESGMRTILTGECPAIFINPDDIAVENSFSDFVRSSVDRNADLNADINLPKDLNLNRDVKTNLKSDIHASFFAESSDFVQENRESCNFSGPNLSAPYSAQNPTYFQQNVESRRDLPSKKRDLSWKKPLILYILTWMSTTFVGFLMFGGLNVWSGFFYSIPVMIIITSHELGHFFVSRKHQVSASLPYFIPVPLPPFGTFGAVIRMDANIPNPKALFDIGISGPLAGLIPTILFLFWGLSLSEIGPLSSEPGSMIFGTPLLMEGLIYLYFGSVPAGSDLLIHPICFAAWTGLFLTSINLFPLGQLDGGHVFYALLKSKAYFFSRLIFYAIALSVLIAALFFSNWQWVLMVALVYLMGVRHPKTRCDSVPIGRFRTILGWAVLLFIFVGFTPNPIQVSEEQPTKKTIPQSTFAAEFLPFEGTTNEN